MSTRARVEARLNRIWYEGATVPHKPDLRKGAHRRGWTDAQQPSTCRHWLFGFS